jgi:hypothetical protein
MVYRSRYSGTLYFVESVKDGRVKGRAYRNKGCRRASVIWFPWHSFIGDINATVPFSRIDPLAAEFFRWEGDPYEWRHPVDKE